MKSIKYALSIVCILLLSSFRMYAPDPAHTLIVFEGSDWCVYCDKFNKEVLSDKTFTDYLQQKGITMVKVDFPQRIKQSREEKERNRRIAEKYAFEGVFPTIVISTGGDEYKKLYYKTGMRAGDVITLIEGELY